MVNPGYYNESLRMFTGVSVVSTDGPAVTTVAAGRSGPSVAAPQPFSEPGYGTESSSATRLWSSRPS